MATEGGRSVLVAVEAPVCGPYPRPRARGSSVRTSVPTGGGGALGEDYVISHNCTGICNYLQFKS